MVIKLAINISSKKSIFCIITLALSLIAYHFFNYKNAVDYLEQNNIEITYKSTFSLSETNIVKINASKAKIKDFSFLPKLTGLIEADLSYTDFNKLEYFEGLTKIEKLDLSGTSANIDNIDIINKSLKHLTINDFEKEIDLSIFHSFKSLELLSIQNSKLENAVNISLPLQLKYIFMSGTEIKDLKFLDEFKNIEILDIGNTKVQNISSISANRKLWALFLNNTEISSIEAISNLSNLRQLNLSETNINDLSPLKNLTSLEELEIAEMNLSANSLSIIKSLKNLKRLDLHQSNINELMPLSNLESLEEIIIDNEQILDIDIFRQLKPQVKIIERN